MAPAIKAKIGNALPGIAEDGLFYEHRVAAGSRIRRVQPGARCDPNALLRVDDYGVHLRKTPLTRGERIWINSYQLAFVGAHADPDGAVCAHAQGACAGSWNSSLLPAPRSYRAGRNPVNPGFRSNPEAAFLVAQRCPHQVIAQSVGGCVAFPAILTHPTLQTVAHYADPDRAFAVHVEILNLKAGQSVLLGDHPPVALLPQAQCWSLGGEHATLRVLGQFRIRLRD